MYPLLCCKSLNQPSYVELGEAESVLDVYKED